MDESGKGVNDPGDSPDRELNTNASPRGVEGMNEVTEDRTQKNKSSRERRGFANQLSPKPLGKSGAGYISLGAYGWAGTSRIFYHCNKFGINSTINAFLDLERRLPTNISRPSVLLREDFIESVNSFLFKWLTGQR